MEALLRAVTLKNYVQIAEKCGLNGYAMLQRNDISPAMISNPEQMLSYAKVLRLLENSATASGQESFGLLMAESRTVADFGEVSLLISHQPTLRTALAAAIDYGNFINRYFALSIEHRGKHVFLREETIAESSLPKRQAVELSTALLNLTCSSILGQQWRPRLVSFTHQRPASLVVHERVFRTKIEFDAAFNGILCDASMLDLPNPKADVEMAALAQRFMGSKTADQSDALLFNLRKAVYLLLPLGKAKIKLIAPSLDMSVRSLQRELSGLGLSFSDVVEGVRQDMVRGHLGNRRNSIERVSVMLGYAKPTSFTRWFASTNGMSPLAWRKSQQQASQRKAIGDN
jgi:AraC-like DNA-binding protein